MEVGNANIRFGYVSEVDHAKGMVKVHLDGEEEDFKTGWLSIVVKSSGGDSEFFPLKVDSHVVCILDEDLEYGVCLGNIYSNETNPGDPGEFIWSLEFENGDFFRYDKENKKFTMKMGDAEIEVSDDLISAKHQASEVIIKTDGIAVKRGGESQLKLLEDILTAIKAATFQTSVGPTSVAINIADFIAIEARLPDLYFE